MSNNHIFSNHMLMIKFLINKRYFLMAGIILGGIIFFFYAFMARPIYEARIIVQPISADNTNTASTGLSALAKLGGSSGPQDTKSIEALALLSSDVFLWSYLRERNVLQALYGETYDEANKVWIRPDYPILVKIRLFISQNINALFGKEVLLEQYEREIAINSFKGLLIINMDDETGIITLSIRWPDPDTAATWTNQYITDINQFIRMRDIELGNNKLEFLKQEISNTGQESTQRALSNLIEKELYNLMLANVKKDYAFAILDPAVAPLYPTFPRKGILIIIGLFTGLVFSVLVLYFIELKKMLKPIFREIEDD